MIDIDCSFARICRTDEPAVLENAHEAQADLEALEQNRVLVLP
jgi:hypothetical protein